MIPLSLRHPWKFDLQGVWLPGGARVLGAFRKRKATFWATLEPHRRSGPRPHWQRTPLLQRNRGRAPNAPAICFLLIAVAILVARKLAQYDGGKAEEENWRRIVSVSGFLQC